MKIKKLEFKGHKVLGDLNVDLTDESGAPLDVVVFIGDNGTGKTEMLKSIVDTIGYTASENPFSSAAIDRSQKSVRLLKNSTRLTVEELNLNDKAECLSFHKFDQKLVFWFPAELNIKKHKMESNPQPLELIEFADKWILDDLNDYIIGEANKAIYRDLSKAEESFYEESKKVNDIFKDLELDIKLDHLSGETGLPVFRSKAGKDVELKGLSSGEKQLFFRLLNLKRLNVNNAIIIVDEPETSLHPEWQRKIIKIYESIGENNQIIMATHSPLILGSVKTEGVRKLIRNDEGKIELELVDQTYGKSVEKARRRFVIMLKRTHSTQHCSSIQ